VGKIEKIKSALAGIEGKKDELIRKAREAKAARDDRKLAKLKVEADALDKKSAIQEQLLKAEQRKKQSKVRLSDATAKRKGKEGGKKGSRGKKAGGLLKRFLEN